MAWHAPLSLSQPERVVVIVLLLRRTLYSYMAKQETSKFVFLTRANQLRVIVSVKCIADNGCNELMNFCYLKYILSDGFSVH